MERFFGTSNAVAYPTTKNVIRQINMEIAYLIRAIFSNKYISIFLNLLSYLLNVAIANEVGRVFPVLAEFGLLHHCILFNIS